MSVLLFCFNNRMPSDKLFYSPVQLHAKFVANRAFNTTSSGPTWAHYSCLIPATLTPPPPPSLCLSRRAALSTK